MKKIKLKWMARSFLNRLLHPSHIIRYLRISKHGDTISRSEFDVQLKLYSRLLPGDFLHYGYFDEPETAPEKISIMDLQQAQLNYAELILKEVSDRNSKVLDVGCGTGGLVNLLLKNGFTVAGLTPDRFQGQYIRQKFPDAEVIHARFQNMDVGKFEEAFGTGINSVAGLRKTAGGTRQIVAIADMDGI